MRGWARRRGGGAAALPRSRPFLFLLLTPALFSGRWGRAPPSSFPSARGGRRRGGLAPKALARVPLGAVGLSRASSTSAVLALHAAPHDLATYDFQPSALLHPGILLSWDSLSLHAGAAFSNFGPWAAAPAAAPAALLALHLPGQELLGAAWRRRQAGQSARPPPELAGVPSELPSEQALSWLPLARVPPPLVPVLLRA